MAIMITARQAGTAMRLSSQHPTSDVCYWYLG